MYSSTPHNSTAHSDTHLRARRFHFATDMSMTCAGATFDMHTVAPVSPYARLQRLQRQLAAGCPLRLAAVGGSSTAGHQLARDSTSLYQMRLAARINRSFPHHEHLVINSGTPASGPQYMEKCLSSQLPAAVNLVIVEYSQNIDMTTQADGLALERLLRRLLRWPSAPAIMYLSLPTRNEAFGKGETHTRTGSTAQTKWAQPLTSHYGIPHVRPRWPAERVAALFQEGSSTILDSKAVHPTDAGHRVVVASLIQTLEEAWAAPVAGVADPLPAPLYSRSSAVHESVNELMTTPHGRDRWDGHISDAGGSQPNTELPDSLCVGGAELSPFVQHAEGFTATLEGTALHPKPGLVASTAGAHLSLCYNVSVACQSGASSEKRCPRVGSVLLGAIGYLRSYDGMMGDARATCSGGCSCDGADEVELLEGWHSQKTSVTWISWMALRTNTPLEKYARGEYGARCPCHVHVRTQPRKHAREPSRTNRSKFKVNMMMLSYEGRMDWVDSWKAQHLAVGDRRRKLRT